MKTKVMLWIMGILIGIGVITNASTQKATVEGTQVTSPSFQIFSTPTQTLTPTITPTVTLKSTPTVSLPVYTATPTYHNSLTVTPESGQSTTDANNNSYYTNANGPAYSTNTTVPAGATAQCADGTYSFSQHHSGSCSHHGGVVQWY